MLAAERLLALTSATAMVRQFMDYMAGAIQITRSK
jgi:hypothetical protein